MTAQFVIIYGGSLRFSTTPYLYSMTPQSALELSGNFLAHPSAELVAEIAQARLTGSLRVSDRDRKCILYFKSGVIAFAVSNARSSRLFDMMLVRKRLTRDDLAQIPNFTNDFEFAAFLREKNFLTKEECDELFVEQISSQGSATTRSRPVI
ncbi:MAG: hypothetical protein IPG67_03425 [Acidobacteria bacterium]|nr:hypothetical protein [Acidobacteriota bacterium]